MQTRTNLEKKIGGWECRNVLRVVSWPQYIGSQRPFAILAEPYIFEGLLISPDFMESRPSLSIPHFSCHDKPT